MLFNSYTWAHTDVTPEEAKNMIDSNAQLIVVDVREVSEYCSVNRHIPGAVNYPWNTGVLQTSYGELPLDGDILVICASGSRSNQAALFLDSQGYLYIYDMVDGMSSWEWDTVGCIDSEGDGVNDDLDNCPDDYNPNQEDTYPPSKNNCGDACECEADFDGDGGVTAADVTTFLVDFGRNVYSNPCTIGDPCNGDFDCDTAVASNDVTKFLEDFGRNIYSNPCPIDCQTGDWCSY